MNFLWAFLIIISYIFALCTGNMDKINNSIYSSINDLVKIVVTIIGNMCFWSGIINIIKNTKLINILKKAIKPIINILFPNEKNNKKAVDYIFNSINTNNSNSNKIITKFKKSGTDNFLYLDFNNIRNFNWNNINKTFTKNTKK